MQTICKGREITLHIIDDVTWKYIEEILTNLKIDDPRGRYQIQRAPPKLMAALSNITSVNITRVLSK